jgi:NAD(P)-dependent dehydrogenase (short-subunit alcohol dehydrogenase family)
VIQFDGRVAIITGGGSGLDWTYAHARTRQFSRGIRPAAPERVPNGGHTHIFDAA